RLAPRTRPATADAVGRLGQHGLDGAHLDLVVVCLDRVYDVLVLAVLPGDLRADDGVAALDLVGEWLADGVQNRAALPHHRVEAGEQHGFGGVVDDQVDAGRGLERADVAALTADDPALHVVAGQVKHGHDRLGRLLARHPLDGHRHDLAGPGLALLLRLVLD